jgi:hypothetical protein
MMLHQCAEKSQYPLVLLAIALKELPPCLICWGIGQCLLLSRMFLSMHFKNAVDSSFQAGEERRSF